MGTHQFRALKEHETFIVLINFGASEHTVNVTKLADGFGDMSEVAAAGADSCFTTG